MIKETVESDRGITETEKSSNTAAHFQTTKVKKKGVQENIVRVKRVQSAYRNSASKFYSNNSRKGFYLRESKSKL